MQNINKSLCATCRGRCCKNNPGLYDSSQLDVTNKFLDAHLGFDMTIVYESFINLDRTGLRASMGSSSSFVVMCDQVNSEASKYINGFNKMLQKENMLFIFAIRPKARKDYEPVGAVTSMGNLRCLSQGDSGCVLNEHSRPRMCLELIPVSDMSNCYYKIGDKALTYSILNSWMPYQDVLVGYVNKWLWSITPDLVKLTSKHGADLNKTNFGEEFVNLRGYKSEDIVHLVNMVLDMNYLNFASVVFNQHK